MQIKYWTDFAKRKNSTKQPTGGTTATVTLKDPCGIASPSFVSAAIPESVKYIEAWGRYYFVSEVTHDGPDIIIDCVSDPMATFKSSIGSYSAYIERSASQSNIWLPDGMITPTNQVVQNVVQPSTLNNTNSDYSTFVVRVTGKNGAKNYLMTEGNIQSAFTTWFDINTLSWATIEESLEALFDSMAQPAQFIQSIKWFPFTVASLSAETVYFGFRSGPSCNRAGDVLSSYADLTIPARYYNDWRDYDKRFTVCTLFIPGYGLLPVDPKYLELPLRVVYDTDVNTGACRIKLQTSTQVLFSADVNIACDIPFGGLSGSGSIVTGLSQIVGSLSLTPLHTLKNAVAGLETTISDYLTPPQSTTGANGNMRAWDTKQVFCEVIRMGSSGQAALRIGSPLMEYKQISTLSGYILCNGASIDISGFKSDRETINEYLNGGFYYE